MAKPVEFTLTGCVDCGVVRAFPKDEPDESTAEFAFGEHGIKMWTVDDVSEGDKKHNLIMVLTDPKRVFMSCQSFAKLRTEDGVAAILSFIGKIPDHAEEISL